MATLKRPTDDTPVDSEEDESQMDSPISQARLAAKKQRCLEPARSCDKDKTQLRLPAKIVERKVDLRSICSPS